MNKNLWLLAGAQGLFLTNNVVFIAINGLVGLSLAPLGWMATLPVMGYVVGGALSTGLVARSQRRGGARCRSSWAGWWPGLGPAVRGACTGQLLAAGAGHGGGGLLQRQRPAVPLCRWRTGRRLPRKGGVAGAGRRPDRRHARPQPGQPHPRLAGQALSGRLPGPGGGGAAVHGRDGRHPLPQSRPRNPPAARPGGRWARSCASRCSSWPPWGRPWATV
jgi:hypothetical protein